MRFLSGFIYNRQFWFVSLLLDRKGGAANCPRS